MFNLLFALLAAYIFYKRGTEYMLKSRIMDSSKAKRLSYAMFMVAGTILGDFFGLSISYHYVPESLWMQAACGTGFSILLGEALYFYSKWLVRKIPSVQERKNY